MEIKRDIQSLADIQLLVDTFYGKVQHDELIGPVFNERIRDQWPVHLQKMYSFWQTVLLDEHTYFGAPFAPHATMPIEAEHFERWLSLFTDTLDALFRGAKTDEAKWRAEKMAKMFQTKLEYFKNNNFRNLI
ncbi:MAG: group III truncated hemoglobin [Taibaiella sp.]|nr:group III truncated hemoglobin [Taibaiella sp.]